MPGVIAKKHESFEALMRRFKKAVERSGLAKELHKREAFMRPGEKKRRAKLAAIKRHAKKKEADTLARKRFF